MPARAAVDLLQVNYASVRSPGIGGAPLGAEDVSLAVRRDLDDLPASEGAVVIECEFLTRRTEEFLESTEGLGELSLRDSGHRGFSFSWGSDVINLITDFFFATISAKKIRGARISYPTGVMTSPFDQGVVLFACQNPSSPPVAVKDRSGNLITGQTLSSTAWRLGFAPAQSDFVSIWITGRVTSNGGSFRLRVEASRDDDANQDDGSGDPLFFPAAISCVRADNGRIGSDLTIAKADLESVMVAGKRLSILVQTTDLPLARSLKLGVLWGQALQAGDWVAVAVEATRGGFVR